MTTTEVQQTLMNEFYDYWQKSRETRETALQKFSGRHQAAVRLGNLNYQVENGGFGQWEHNGYGDDVDVLIELCEEGAVLGIESFKKLKSILLKFKAVPSYENSTEEEDCDRCGGVGHLGDEDDETYCNNMCEDCYGTGEITNETDNDNERSTIFSELTSSYFDMRNILDDMNMFLQRWDEIDLSKGEMPKEQNEKLFKNNLIHQKPLCDLRGVDGNVFVIIGHVNRTLKKAKQYDKAKEFSKKAIDQESYDAVLQLISDYVEIRI